MARAKTIFNPQYGEKPLKISGIYKLTESINPISRNPFVHKHNCGHALLICGRMGMMGAAVLATKGAVRSGCGLVTTHIPESERFIVQCTTPEALLSTVSSDTFSGIDNIERFDAIGIGPAVGQINEDVLLGLYLSAASHGIPMVIDADALRTTGECSRLVDAVPKGSVFTPHTGELHALIGDWTLGSEMLDKTLEFAHRTQSVVVIKGAYSAVCLPCGEIHFNSTGNAGMAKGGSGDILTGLITGLMARGLDNAEAAIRGVFVHGRAGDKAAERYGQESMSASDITEYIDIR